MDEIDELYKQILDEIKKQPRKAIKKKSALHWRLGGDSPIAAELAQTAEMYAILSAQGNIFSRKQLPKRSTSVGKLPPHLQTKVTSHPTTPTHAPTTTSVVAQTSTTSTTITGQTAQSAQSIISPGTVAAKQQIFGKKTGQPSPSQGNSPVKPANTAVAGAPVVTSGATVVSAQPSGAQTPANGPDDLLKELEDENIGTGRTLSVAQKLEEQALENDKKMYEAKVEKDKQIMTALNKQIVEYESGRGVVAYPKQSIGEELAHEIDIVSAALWNESKRLKNNPTISFADFADEFGSYIHQAWPQSSIEGLYTQPKKGHEFEAVLKKIGLDGRGENSKTKMTGVAGRRLGAKTRERFTEMISGQINKTGLIIPSIPGRPERKIFRAKYDPLSESDSNLYEYFKQLPHGKSPMIMVKQLTKDYSNLDEGQLIGGIFDGTKEIRARFGGQFDPEATRQELKGKTEQDLRKKLVQITMKLEYNIDV